MGSEMCIRDRYGSREVHFFLNLFRSCTFRQSPIVADCRRSSPLVADCRRSETEKFAQRRKSSLMPCGLRACEKLTFELSLDNDIKVTGHSITQSLNNNFARGLIPRMDIWQWLKRKKNRPYPASCLLRQFLKAMYLAEPTLPSFLIEEQPGQCHVRCFFENTKVLICQTRFCT